MKIQTVAFEQNFAKHENYIRYLFQTLVLRPISAFLTSLFISGSLRPCQTADLFYLRSTSCICLVIDTQATYTDIRLPAEQGLIPISRIQFNFKFPLKSSST